MYPPGFSVGLSGAVVMGMAALEQPPDVLRGPGILGGYIIVPPGLFRGFDGHGGDGDGCAASPGARDSRGIHNGPPGFSGGLPRGKMDAGP